MQFIRILVYSLYIIYFSLIILLNYVFNVFREWVFWMHVDSSAVSVHVYMIVKCHFHVYKLKRIFVSFQK